MSFEIGRRQLLAAGGAAAVAVGAGACTASLPVLAFWATTLLIASTEHAAIATIRVFMFIRPTVRGIRLQPDSSIVELPCLGTNPANAGPHVLDRGTARNRA